MRPPHDPAVAEDERYAPILPGLDLTSSPILGPRPPAITAIKAPSSDALRLGEELSGITQTAQRTTLAGFRLLDANGAVIAGRGDIGFSFAHVPEVRAALAGRFGAVMRQRDEEAPQPPLYSISRGTNVRVFVAMPVFVDNHVRGVVYASRTPDNILRQLYQERFKVAIAAFLVLAASLLIGVAFVRAIARPMQDLASRAETITKGGRDAIGPLRHHGTQELYSLSQSLMTMAKRLSDRSDYLSTFASHVSHELKTPLTSLRGAAELMRDTAASMRPEESRRFLSNMLGDVDRMIVLLDQLRELARADNPRLGGAITMSEATLGLRQRFENLQIEVEGGEISLAMSEENAAIVFGHLLENAANHGPEGSIHASVEGAAAASSSPTMAMASRPATAPGSSSPSSPPAAPKAARAWASVSSTHWCARMAATLRLKVASAARALPCGFRFIPRLRWRAVDGLHVSCAKTPDSLHRCETANARGPLIKAPCRNDD